MRSIRSTYLILSGFLSTFSRNFLIPWFLTLTFYRLSSHQLIPADLPQLSAPDQTTPKVGILIMLDARGQPPIMAAGCNLQPPRTSVENTRWKKPSMILLKSWHLTPQSLCRLPMLPHSSAISADKSLLRTKEVIAPPIFPGGFKRTKN
jgi:hypothetical protein